MRYSPLALVALQVLWTLLFCQHWTSVLAQQCADGSTDASCSAASDNGIREVSVSWGPPQTLSSPESSARYEEAEAYMKTVMEDPFFEPVRDLCKAKDPNCVFWASTGECETNPVFMQKQCAPACNSCDYLDYATRCRFDSHDALWKEKDQLETLFRRMVKENDKVTVLLEDPWVITIDDFVSAEDSKLLTEWGTKLGYERSVDAGEILADGTMDKKVSSGRTSTNAWCIEDCYRDAVTQRVVQKVEDVIHMPREHYEYFQLLKYGPGQFYEQHNDFNPSELTRPQGNRILTVYLYLNEVEQGGGTRFPEVNITVMPKRGRALIWPSVLNAEPFARDDRTDHEALPVEAGLKFGANIWVHQRDFQAAFAINCV